MHACSYDTLANIIQEEALTESRNHTKLLVEFRCFLIGFKIVKEKYNFIYVYLEGTYIHTLYIYNPTQANFL